MTKRIDIPVKHLSAGRLFDLFREGGVLTPGLTFFTSSTSASVVNYARRKGVVVNTHRLYTINRADRSVVQFVQVTVLEVHDRPTTNN